jgi:hypothetical protein
MLLSSILNRGWIPEHPYAKVMPHDKPGELVSAKNCGIKSYGDSDRSTLASSAGKAANMRLFAGGSKSPGCQNDRETIKRHKGLQGHKGLCGQGLRIPVLAVLFSFRAARPF